MLPSHSSCLTVNVNGPAVNLVFCTSCSMSGHSLFERLGVEAGVSVSNPCDHYTISRALKSEHCRVRRQAEEDAADRLVMRLPPLGLLRGGVHVAEAALERAVVGDRRRAGAVIEGVDHLARMVNRPGRGEPDQRVLLEAQFAGLADRLPDFGKTAQEEGTRRTQPSLGLRQLRLDHLVLAQKLAGAARRLLF